MHMIIFGDIIWWVFDTKGADSKYINMFEDMYNWPLTMLRTMGRETSDFSII